MTLPSGDCSRSREISVSRTVWSAEVEISRPRWSCNDIRWSEWTCSTSSRHTLRRHRDASATRSACHSIATARHEVAAQFPPLLAAYKAGWRPLRWQSRLRRHPGPRGRARYGRLVRGTTCGRQWERPRYLPLDLLIHHSNGRDGWYGRRRCGGLPVRKTASGNTARQRRRTGATAESDTASMRRRSLPRCRLPRQLRPRQNDSTFARAGAQQLLLPPGIGHGSSKILAYPAEHANGRAAGSGERVLLLCGRARWERSEGTAFPECASSASASSLSEDLVIVARVVLPPVRPKRAQPAECAAPPLLVRKSSWRGAHRSCPPVPWAWPAMLEEGEAILSTSLSSRAITLSGRL